MKPKFVVWSVVGWSILGTTLPVGAQDAEGGPVIPDGDVAAEQRVRRADQQRERDYASGASNADGDTYINAQGQERPKSELREYGGTVDSPVAGLEDEGVRMERLQAAGIDFAVLPSAEEAARLLAQKEGRRSRRTRRGTGGNGTLSSSSGEGLPNENTLSSESTGGSKSTPGSQNPLPNTGGEPLLVMLAGCLVAGGSWWMRRKLV